MLVLTLDVLTERMAGPAIRAWHIADTLAADHDVHLASMTELCTVTSDRFRVSAVDNADLAGLEAWCDIVVLQGFAFRQAVAFQHTDKIVVVDVYDPLHLETLELAKQDPPETRGRRVIASVDVLKEQLSRGDFFVCASDKQRDFWLGMLSAIGRVNPETYDADPTLRTLIDTVPFGMPDGDPTLRRRVLRGVMPGIDDDAEILIWAGGIYNWFDPLSLIRAVDRLREKRPRLRLFFMGLRHPNPHVEAMRMAFRAQELADELGLTDRYVFFNAGWVSYDERQDYLLEADIGVSTHFEHAETAYSFRTRILDYLWCSLPIVATDGDSFAELIGREDLGAVVPPEDVDALCAAIDGLLADPARGATCRANVERVRPSYRWSTVLGPLVAFCRQPQRAADLTGVIRPHRRRLPVTVRNLRGLPRWVYADARIVARLGRARARAALSQRQAR